MQITNQNTWLWSSVHRCQRWEQYKKFHKPPITFENFPRVSKVFRAFRTLPKIFENFQKFSKSVGRSFENFPTFSDFFRRLSKISEDFRQFPKISKQNSKMLETYLKHVAKNFRKFPKISEDIRRIPKISNDFQEFYKKKLNAGRSSWALCDIFRFFPKISEVDFRRFPKVFKNFGKLSECLFLHSSVLFLKLFKEFPNIQQRRHEPLLQVTDRPLIFSCMFNINK